MKKIIAMAFILSMNSYTQIQSSVTFDPQTRNYIVTYDGGLGEDGQPVPVVVIYEPPTKINPFVIAVVRRNLDSNNYQFSYALRNDASSQQRLEVFDIDVFTAIRNLNSPHRSWWQHSFKYRPVLGWVNSKSDDGIATPYDGIAPDSSEAGFSFSSNGLPGIINAYFRGAPTIILAFPNEPPGDIKALLDPIRRFPNDCVIRKTVGPKDPPSPFVVLDFLDTLLSYTRQSVSLGWLKSNRDNDCDGDEKPQDGVSKNLEKRLNKVRTELTKGNSLKASRELEKFIKKVERVSKRTEVMTSEAYALLKYNAEYLASRIITLPARPTGTLLQQIDELKAELTRQQSKKNIGGVLLVKSLTFLVDQAKKQLQKPLPSTSDSAAAALSIAAFQLFVDEVWELTEAISGKSKKLPALYVYDEAYIQLHYRAKYILESLPAPRTLIDVKSVEMDDDVRKEFDALQKMSKEQ